jgi:thiol-disulfide isomerase/thioredoxin
VTSEPSNKPRLIVAAIIVLAAGAGGFFFYRAQQEAPATLMPTAANETSAHAADPGSEPSDAGPETTAAAKKIPDVLPDVTLADRDGKPTKLLSLAGRPLMVNFWATWCAPCRREIPLLNTLRAQRQAKNTEIVGIAVDFKEDVLKFTERVPVNYPLLIGEEDGLAAAEAFGMGMAFPFSIFSDSQNRIVAVKIGELHENEANFAFDRVLDIDAGRLTLADAQRQIAEAFSKMATERAAETAKSGTDAAH